MNKNRNYVKARIKALTPVSEPTKNEPYGKKEIIILAIITLFGLIPRLTPLFNMGGTYAKLGRYLPISDDGFLHGHLVDQILQYGYLPNPDPLSWAPQGHPASYPFLYHYTIASLTVLTHQPSWLVSFIFPVFVGVFSIVSIYLLCRKLFGSIGGITAAGVVAFSLLILNQTTVSRVLPSHLALLLFTLSLWLLLKAGLRYSILAGFVYGLSALTWAGSLVFYLPVFIAFFILSKPSIKNFIATSSISALVAAPFYLPVILKYGILSFAYQNVPDAIRLNDSWADSWYVSTTLQAFGWQYLLVFTVSVPFVLYLAIARKVQAYRYALVWLVPALFTVWLGSRWIGVYFEHALVICIAGLFSYLWYFKRERFGVRTTKTPYRTAVKIILLLLLLLSFSPARYIPDTSNQHLLFYQPYIQYAGLDKAVPKGSTVLAWWPDGFFLSYYGFKNVADGFWQQLPDWAPQRVKDIATVYLSHNQTEVFSILKKLNVSYVLVSKSYVLQLNHFTSMVRTYDPNADPLSYITVEEERTNQGIRKALQGLSHKGSMTLLGRLAFPESVGQIQIIGGIPYEIPAYQSENFELVWKSGDNVAFLYRVKGNS